MHPGESQSRSLVLERRQYPVMCRIIETLIPRLALTAEDVRALVEHESEGFETVCIHRVVPSTPRCDVRVVCQAGREIGPRRVV